MFGWRSNVPQPAPAPELSLHDTLVQNTLAYRNNSATRIEDAAQETYRIVKNAVLAHSKKNLTTMYTLNTVNDKASSCPLLAQLAANERDHALVTVRDRLVNVDKVECHIDGTVIKILWRLPETVPQDQ
jgi:hypothetical protein